jgi:catechol O-methyltransferase
MKNNQSERKKSSLPFRVNKKSFIGVISLVCQELTEIILTRFYIKLPKEEEVLNKVRTKAKFNDPDSVLEVIDDYAYKKTFLMNIGDEKGLLLENAIRESEANNILELGVYLGYSTIRILKNLDSKSQLTSIESNKKFAEIAKEHISISGLSKNHNLIIGRSNEVIPSLNETYDFVFIDHWKDLYLKDLKSLEENNLIKKDAWIFADNVILFNLEDYLSYVRSSQKYISRFIPTKREYSKSHPDGVEISIYKDEI